MSLSSKLDDFHRQTTENRWLWLFSIFCRIILAVGFIPPGIMKIMGERFTVLSVNHPMGNYLEALHHTGYYYTMIGVMQVVAGVLLLIPRTVILGAFIYFPIILNICILSLAVRFEGSRITSPLMVLANLYLICWYYPAWKSILPFNRPARQSLRAKWRELHPQFPFKFFSGVALAFTAVILFAVFGNELVPRNTLKECRTQCDESDNPAACYTFCDCIHKEGQPLNKCLETYNNASGK
ncbi:DoxX family protein [Rufibacter hautae]|uniref:DoxX family protein n=1 Tax=Rufibacter hautae TaxID=2595005 RepID=A0A5B6TCQ5_9BACT|nr:DoxX family protein [Rufibacter hautae]KAA3437946.1 DoxX family protein [Rufibacter hautae]